MANRPNRDIALRYWNDPTLQAWHWQSDLRRWRLYAYPNFHAGTTWHVGHKAPTEPPARMCELAGIKFPMPMREAPKMNADCWRVLAGPKGAFCLDTWTGCDTDLYRLNTGVYQATREGAIAQSRAVAAALRQAIEGAK